MVAVLLSIVKEIIIAGVVVISAYFYTKYKLKEHEDRIKKLESEPKASSHDSIITRHQAMIDQLKEKVDAHDKDISGMTNTLGVKIDKLSEKLSETAEKVAFMFGSIQTMESISKGLETYIKNTGSK